LLLGDIAIPLRALRPPVRFAQVTPSRVAPLCPTLLATTHRRRREQHEQHDRDRDDDHDDTRTHRENRDKGQAQGSHLLGFLPAGHPRSARRAAHEPRHFKSRNQVAQGV
jgi:hypothetical protein